MGSIIGHRIDYNEWGRGSERPAAHTQQQKWAGGSIPWISVLVTFLLRVFSAEKKEDLIKIVSVIEEGWNFKKTVLIVFLVWKRLKNVNNFEILRQVFSFFR